MHTTYEFLDRLGISYHIFNHEAVFSAEEAEKLKDLIPGQQVKNLFLRNEKKTHYILVTVADNKRVDLKHLAKTLMMKNLSFASPEDLMEYLKVTPGSVSPLGLMNDEQKKVQFVMDEDLLKLDTLFIHPNINTATIGISITDFNDLMHNLGYDIISYKVQH